MTPRLWAWFVAGLGVVAALGLLLPWATTGDRSRSTFELIESASALDLLDGRTRVLVIGGWVVVVVGAAAGVVGVAWEHLAVARAGLVVVGPALIGAALAITWSPLSVAWGAWVAAGVGAAASIGSGLLLRTDMAQSEGWSR